MQTSPEAPTPSLRTILLGHVQLFYPKAKSVEIMHDGALVLTAEDKWITVDQRGKSYPHASRAQGAKFLFDVAVDYRMDPR
jgi:hypothetical protein